MKNLFKQDTLSIPKATKKVKVLENHGIKRKDPYFWLNQRENPDVIKYLNEENSFHDQYMSQIQDLQTKIFQEIVSIVKDDDIRLPYKKNGYLYFTEFELGKQYPNYYRRKEEKGSKKELLFDVSQMAKGYMLYNLSGISVSEDNSKIAYCVDNFGRQEYDIFIKDLNTGETLKDRITSTSGDPVWANDNKSIFYSKLDPITLRSYKVLRHTINTDQSKDVEIFFEKDEAFSCFVYKTKSKKFIMLGTSSTTSCEYWYSSADQIDMPFLVVQPRLENLEYSVAHYGDYLYVLNNKDGAFNFKLSKTTIDKPGADNWETVLEHREDVLLEDISLYKDYMTIEERLNGIINIRIKFWDESQDYKLDFKEDTYTVKTQANPDFDTDIVRYSYNSLTTPSLIIDYNVKTREKNIIKQQKVYDENFNVNNYTSERIWVTARDGEKIAMSVVKRKDVEYSLTTPILIFAYGAYGLTIDPTFSAPRLCLIDRGFVFIIAHVRGGEYLGRKWYEDGRLLNKKNTFTDFEDCSKFLLKNKYTSSKHLYACSASAGGLLIGYVLNNNPGMFNGVIMSVPFVDIVTTMLDESLPLTTGEYEEWGNPNDKDYFEYMLSYSPYDNIKKQPYPHMLVSGGLYDAQVQYFEPAKWVAKLREMKTDSNILLLKINMESGHGGSSGRYNTLRNISREFAFLIHLEEIAKSD